MNQVEARTLRKKLTHLIITAKNIILSFFTLVKSAFKINPVNSLQFAV